MKNFQLAIDIGHNVPYDKGANGIKNEDKLNLLVGNALIKRLKDRGLEVVNCTPTSASSLKGSLEERCKIANSTNSILFVSIHHNAARGGYGSEVLCIKDNFQDGLSTRVGANILNELQGLGLRNRGVKDRRDLYVLNATKMSALIVECAFVDSEMDMNGYNTEKVADAICSGILKALNIENTNISYTVKKGDTLWGISKSFNTTVDELVRINGIKDRNLISVGEIIKIK